MKFEAIIFDLDGTLIDSLEIWKKIDKDFLESKNIEITKDLFEDLEGGNSFIEVAAHFKKKFNLKESIDEIMQNWMKIAGHHYKNTVKLKPNVIELLDFLKEKKVKIAVGTSNIMLLTEMVLKKNSAFDYFDVIVTGEDVTRGKPFPDIFLKAAKELDVNPKKCLVIEDLVEGVKAAKNAGMSVWVIFDKYSESKKDELQKISDEYFENFPDLLNKLKSER